MSVNVDQGPLAESGATPDVIGGVVILEHVDLFRLETDSAGPIVGRRI
jgi:hypothetical protein